MRLLPSRFAPVEAHQDQFSPDARPEFTPLHAAWRAAFFAAFSRRFRMASSITQVGFPRRPVRLS
jgi:hypothetical protein